MRYFFLLLFTIPQQLLANLDELFIDQGDPALFHHVNVISGQLNLSFDDATVQGAFPLSLQRTYSSSGALKPHSEGGEYFLEKRGGGWAVEGGWHLLEETRLLLFSHPNKPLEVAYVAESNGARMRYVYESSKGNVLLLKPDKKYFKMSGAIGARTSLNNNELLIETTHGKATLKFPDGRRRIYKGHRINPSRLRDDRSRCQTFYRLMCEEFPDGKQIVYSYDNDDRLMRIEAKNPARTKTFAWINLEYKKNKKQGTFDLHVTCSDGKELHYKSLNHQDCMYLDCVQSNCHPAEKSFFTPGRKSLGARMRSITFDGKEQLEVSYYKPIDHKAEQRFAKKPEKMPLSVDKVKSLSAPVGLDGAMVPVAHFSYAKTYTDVRDAEGILTRYHHDTQKIVRIDYYDKGDILFSSQAFFWEGRQLSAKALCDGSSIPLLSKTFHYDIYGNVILEQFSGNLTGSKEPLHLDSTGKVVSGESYSRHYTYHPRHHLLASESEENGLTIFYDYALGTDLLTAKWTYAQEALVKREFFRYDSDALLVEEIVDDGTTRSLLDLTGVSQRLIKQYRRDQTSGLITESALSYLNSGKLQLLSKEHFHYGASKLPVQIDYYDGNGAFCYSSTARYDSFGNLLSQTNPIGQENRYAYDTFGRLVESDEIGAPHLRFEYDTAGRKIRSVDLDNHERDETVFDLKDRAVCHIDPYGSKIEQEYDAFGRCLVSHLSSGATIQFEYDTFGNIRKTTMALGETTTAEYNVFRKATTLTYPDGAPERHTYTKNGFLARTIYSDESSDHFEYDRFGRIVRKYKKAGGIRLAEEVWHYNTFHLLSHTDMQGVTTSFFYDGAGRKVREEKGSSFVNYSYNSLGFVEKEENGLHAQIKEYDVAGRVVKQQTELPNGAIENVTEYSYSPNGKINSITKQTSAGVAVDRACYDNKNRLIELMDPEGGVTRWIYEDALFRSTQINALGHQTIEEKNAQGLTASIEKQDNLGKREAYETFEYDLSGNLIEKKSYVYSDGMFVRTRSQHFERDAMGRPTVIAHDNGVTRNTFDLQGRLIAQEKPSGITLYFRYDPLNRLEVLKSSDNSVHYRYSYERGPHPVTVEDLIAGTSITRRYGTSGELLSENGLNWSYDPWLRPSSFELPDHSHIAYQYEGPHLVSVQRISAEGEHLYAHNYTRFDHNGHAVEEELISGLGLIEKQYDLLGRPTSQNNPWFQETLAFDALGQIRHTDNSFYGKTLYTYDPLQQLIQENEQHYPFDSLGNRSDWTTGEQCQLLEKPGLHITYDPDGRPRNGDEAEYLYDALDRLISITTPHTTVSYTYDGFSRLVSKTSNDSTQLFLYDHALEIGTTTSDGTILELKVLGASIRGDIGAAVAIEIGQDYFVPLHDVYGSIIALIDPLTSTITEEYHLNAFGQELSPTPHANPWRFSSKRHEGALVFFGTRFYVPSSGRWLTSDPAGDVDSANLYLFVRNDPINRLDLFGFIAETRHEHRCPEFTHELLVNIPDLPLFSKNLVHIQAVDHQRIIDIFVSCGHFHNLVYSPEENASGKVDLLKHLPELTGGQHGMIGVVTMTNGMNVNHKEFEKSCDKTVNELPGTFFLAVHNISKGFCSDAWRVAKEVLRKKETRGIAREKQLFSMLSEGLLSIDATNPAATPSLWQHFAHSEGGAITRYNIEGQPPELQEFFKNRLLIITLGSASPIPKSYAKDARNFYSRQDFVTGSAGLIEMALGTLRSHNSPLNCNIEFVSCSSKWSERSFFLADHAYCGGTYSKVRQDEIRTYKRTYGYYNGQNR